MVALDGNAIAGTLFETFGREMTTATGVCGRCGAESRLAEVDIYLAGPGVVARCPQCEDVLLVLVEIHGITCVDAMGLAALRPMG